MTYWLRIGLMALATLLAAGSATLLFRARNDKADVTGLPVFFLESLFPAGRRLRKLLKRKDRSSRDRYRKLLELYTPGEADRIRRQAMDAGYTYLLLQLPLLLLMLAVTGDVLLGGIELLLLTGLCLYFDYWLDSTVGKRHAELETQYPSMLTEMSLMVNVGITAGEAFERVAVSGNGLLFREMQRVTESVKNGMPIDEALDTLSTRAPPRGNGGERLDGPEKLRPDPGRTGGAETATPYHVHVCRHSAHDHRAGIPQPVLSPRDGEKETCYETARISMELVDRLYRKAAAIHGENDGGRGRRQHR